MCAGENAAIGSCPTYLVSYKQCYMQSAFRLLAWEYICPNYVLTKEALSLAYPSYLLLLSSISLATAWRSAVARGMILVLMSPLCLVTTVWKIQILRALLRVCHSGGVGGVNSFSSSRRSEAAVDGGRGYWGCIILIMNTAQNCRSSACQDFRIILTDSLVP